MIHKFSNVIANKLALLGVIQEERQRVYAYGLELLLASTLGVALLVIVSILFKKPFMWVPYLLAFIPFRLNAGGYHARSHFWCIVIFSSLYAALTIILYSTPPAPHFPFIISVMCMILVLIFAPIETVNNPLKAGKTRLCRRNSIILSVLNLMFSVLAYFFYDALISIIISYFSGLTAAAIFFIVVICESIYERRKTQ